MKRNDSEENKKTNRKTDKENLYFNFQLAFTTIILIVSFALCRNDSYVFDYAKENYHDFFETDRYMENTFSYNSFWEKCYNELQIRYGQLVTVFNQFSAKGSADIIPANVSEKKFYMENKGTIPVKGYISSPYGIRTNPFDKKTKEFHTGMDIAAAKGSFICAAFNGVVKECGASSMAGNYIRIQSENNIETFYAHNQFNLVRKGDIVLEGQVIATVGQTGNATGPHLHFEFISDNIRYNPAYVIQI